MGDRKEDSELEAGEEFGNGEPEEESQAAIARRKEMPQKESAKGGHRRKRAAEDENAEIDDSEERRAAAAELPDDMKLEKIVALPTWREMLMDLVATKKLDPWNIDIVEIATGYLEKIKKMEMLDLRVPANLILAAAILLRFKSQALRFEEEVQVVEEQTYVEEDAEPSVIPVLELKARIPPTRMVTLDELLSAMEKVFDDQKKREEKAHRVEIPTVINIQMPEFNIEERMEKVYGKILGEKDTEGLATFSALLDDRTPVEMMATLLPLLHLVQDRRVTIVQEQTFGDRFRRVTEASEAQPARG